MFVYRCSLDFENKCSAPNWPTKPNIRIVHFILPIRVKLKKKQRIADVGLENIKSKKEAKGELCHFHWLGFICGLMFTVIPFNSEIWSFNNENNSTSRFTIIKVWTVNIILVKDCYYYWIAYKWMDSFEIEIILSFFYRPI